jgi:class 3 adenylate cyclase
MQKKIPNFQIKLGFGLHYGWAIEGAIGSEFKIDASYLSPNVNLASRLESATK